MHISEAELAGAPAVIVSAAPHAVAAVRGVVLFHHGLYARKEGNMKEYQSLAAAGLLAVGIDAVGHGARTNEGWHARLGREGPDFERNFLDAVRATAAGVPAIIDDLAARGLAHPGRIGICGISMGAMIAYLAVTLEPRIRSATPILGTPRWRIESPDEPRHHTHAFRDVALLAQVASLDTIVPPWCAREFHWELRRRFPEASHAFHEYPASDHFMREDEWHACWERAVAWHVAHLSR